MRLTASAQSVALAIGLLKPLLEVCESFVEKGMPVNVVTEVALRATLNNAIHLIRSAGGDPMDVADIFSYLAERMRGDEATSLAEECEAEIDAFFVEHPNLDIDLPLAVAPEPEGRSHLLGRCGLCNALIPGNKNRCRRCRDFAP